MDPYSSEPFEYLGRFYSQIQRDKVKAKRCFQKAFDLDRTNEGAGEALCDLMVELEEEVCIVNVGKQRQSVISHIQSVYMSAFSCVLLLTLWEI